ncbi:MAG: carbohydrate porin [Candidatus Omnitrophica bacterium]|nr:carbohydrate porin [Candidatus Omnitrophota bacterium]
MKRVAIAVLFCFAWSGFARAEDEGLKEMVRKLEARVDVLEQQVAAQDQCINEQSKCMLTQSKKIEEYESKLSRFDTLLHRQEGAPMSITEGLTIGAGATMIVQGTQNVNDATVDVPKKGSRSDASYSADITIAKEFEESSGKAFLHLETGKGSGLEDNLTLYSNVNRDADDDENVRMTEFWYEQRFANDKSSLVFGKLDPTAYFDNNEIANDETTQFLGRIFRNSPVIEFSDNSAGLRLAYLPWEHLEVGYGVFDGDNDWEKIGDNLFTIGQVTFTPNIFDLPGHYRFYGWHNNAYHTQWYDETKTKEHSYGFGVSFDQKVTESVTLFTRWGWQNPRVYNPEIAATGGGNFSLAQSWSAGVQVEGEPWGREKDILAFAVGQVIPSDEYKKAGSLLAPDPGRRAKTESHLEAYYRIYVNDHLAITPDFQYIFNPFGRDVFDDTNGIFVGGLRAQVDF